MNSRYFLTADSPCNIGNSVSVTSILQTGEERSTVRVPPNPRNRPSRNSSAPPILIKLAMKISRARWYSFLRRVFHYQNGSGSDLGPNPLNSGRWMLLEFICLVVQISITICTLIVSKGETPVWPMRIWVSGYALGCFVSIVLLHSRYRVVFTFQEDPNSNFSDVQQRSSDESRNLQKFRTWVELLFAIWFVMGNIWVFDSRFGSYNGAPKLHVLCVSLLAWNAVSYSFPFILFVLLCCCVPFLSGLLGYNINTALLDRGATDDQITRLPCWKYKEDDVRCDLELGDEIPECCICLAMYKEKEEMRELPCNHIFHRRCVDQWLKILSCCPLWFLYDLLFSLARLSLFLPRFPSATAPTPHDPTGSFLGSSDLFPAILFLSIKMSLSATFVSPITTLSIARSEFQCLKPKKNVCFIPVGLRPLHLQHSFRVKRASICTASLNATCSAEQTQTVTRQSSTITVAPIQGKEKSPELDDGGTGFPPRDDDGGGGGGGGGGGHWSGGFFFFGFLAFLGFLKDQESEGPYREERRR